MSELFNLPFAIPVNGNGEVMPGCKLYFYDAGTSNKRATYFEADLDVSHQNTHPVEADGDGRFNTIYITGSNAYKVILTDKDDVEIWSKDSILPIQSLIETVVAGAITDSGFQTVISTPVGAILPFMGATAPEGYLLLNGQTIGNVSSGATARANNDTQSLYVLLWDSLANAEAPVIGGRGPNALSDFGAGKPITLPDLRGRTIVGKDNMGGAAANRLTLASKAAIDGTKLGYAGGVQEHTLTGKESGTSAHSHSVRFQGTQGGADSSAVGELTANVAPTLNPKYTQLSTEASAVEAHTNMPPSMVANWIIRYADSTINIPKYRGAWSNVTTYAVNDVVTHGGSAWIAILEHVNHEPASALYWQVFSAKAMLGWVGEWNNIAQYVIGDVVRHISANYVALTNNLNSEPTRTGTTATNPDWALSVIDGLPGANGDLTWLGAWSGATPYAANDAVTLNGSSYRCKLAHVNHTPPNATYWDVIAAKGDTGATGPTGPMAELKDDTTPELGGDLSVNGKKIISVSNGNIELAPNGTGRVILDGVSWPLTDGSANQILKTNGAGAASWSDNLPRGYHSGCKLSNNVTDANNDIDISAGAWRNSDNDGDIVLASALTKQLDANWVAGTNQGMLDTGSKASGTTYAVFLIKNLTNSVVDLLASASLVSPTMPSGYTKKRRIGCIMTDGSGNIRAFTQDGDYFFWVTPTLDVSTTALGTSASFFALSVPNGLALIAGFVAFSNSTGNNIYLSSLAAADMAPSTSAAPLTTLAYTTSPGHAQFYQLLTNTTQQIRARSGAASSTLRVVTFYYIDRRGRDD